MPPVLIAWAKALHNNSCNSGFNDKGMPTTVNGKRCAVILGDGNGTVYVANI